MQRFFILGLLACGLFPTSATADEPGWWGRVIAPQSVRPRLRSTPIIYRPYRPFHFYGNTIRREYYRGTPLPAPRDVVQGGGALILRR